MLTGQWIFKIQAGVDSHVVRELHDQIICEIRVFNNVKILSKYHKSSI